MKRIGHLGFFILLIIFSRGASAAEYYNKQWTVANIMLSMPGNEKFKYYIEPQLRLIDDPYVFNQAFLLLGLGYQIAPSLIVLAGPGWVLNKNTSGVTFHEYRLWQQLTWFAMNNPAMSLVSRTRLEEKERSNQSGIALQLRERLWLRIPIKNTEQWYYSFFDEAFFNLNHPAWVSPYFLEQNRAFIGLGKQVTKSTIIDFGYLNQQQLGPPREFSSVLLLSFTVNS